MTVIELTRLEFQTLLQLLYDRALLESLRCPYCGGVDAHLWNCKGGYGL